MKSGLIGRELTRIRRARKATAVRAPLAAVVLDGASSVTSPTNHSINRRDANGLAHQVFKPLQPETLQPAFVQVCEQWIEAFVPGENKAFGLRCRLHRSPKLECDVEVEGIFSVAFDLLEINPLEPVGGRRLACCLRWVLLGSNKDDGAKALI